MRKVPGMSLNGVDASGAVLSGLWRLQSKFARDALAPGC